MLFTFEAGPWQTNCWILSTGVGTECVIVDPGMDALPRIRDKVAAANLKPIAVLLSHGHIDHMFSVLPVADGYDIPAFVHPADRDRIGNPYAKMSADTRGMLKQLGVEFAEPSDLREVVDAEQVSLAGFEFTVRHAPGHTEGSVVFQTVHDGAPTIFSGDVLFAGSVGRSDLEGGSPDDMERTLRTVILPLADETTVHCGHGPSTTIGRERRSNPYLRMVM
jgi:glyoxylase-like metal-dependent hydrolase (beta-lactamase superfamily II)